MINEADKNEMCRMRRLGFTLDYIAKATGYSASSVANATACVERPLASSGKDKQIEAMIHKLVRYRPPGAGVQREKCALPGFVDSKNEEKTERNAGYLVVSHSGGGMLRQGTRKGIRRTPANRGMRAHWVVKGLDISEDVCHGMCP